jgi:hypothetical protein
MPLRAFIDNEEIISIDQTDEQWNRLKKRVKSGSSLKLPCSLPVSFPVFFDHRKERRTKRP